MNSKKEYGYSYVATEVTNKELTFKEWDHPLVPLDEAKELLRDRGDDSIFQNGYMDRTLEDNCRVCSGSSSSDEDSYESGGEILLSA